MKNLAFTILLILSIFVLVALLFINFSLREYSFKGIRFAEENLNLDHIITVPDQLILDISDTQKLTAFVANRAGRLLSNYTVSWSIEDTALADIDSLHFVIAKKPGKTTATAYTEDSEGTPFSKSITVVIIPDGMSYIPAGDFLMGSNMAGMVNEQPLRRVYIDGFFIDKYEVTNEKFAVFLNHTSQDYYDKRMQIIKRKDNYSALEDKKEFPVNHVSWFAAVDYARWTGKRLPTEAEWEKGARGDKDARDYPSGSEISGSEANFRKSGDPFEPELTPVGYYNGLNKNGFQTRRSASQYGIHDMAGNVAEWTADWYDLAFYKQNVIKNPIGPESGKERSIRGGSWFDTPARLRVSYRTSGNPIMNNEMVGFRCAKSIE